MNNEFKKIVSKTETRYILESASAGATSSGSIASGPVGKKGNLLVQGKDDKPVVQRRNPVAANVNAAVGGGGAGVHKDKTKVIPRKEKYKKDFRKDVDESAVPPKVRFNPKPMRVGPGTSKDDYRYTKYIPRGKEAGEYWAIQQSVDDRNRKLKKEKPKSVPNTDFYKNYLQSRPAREESEIVPEVKQRLDPKCWKGYKKQGTKMKGGVRVNNCVPKEGYGMNSYSTVAGGEPIAKHVPEDNVNPGYIDQENGMTTSDLKGLYQQAVKLRSLVKRMGDDTTLEPWQQTKIAKAADYINSVFRSLDDEYGLDNLEEAEKKGLWANIHARRKKGLPPRKPGEKGAPSKKSWDTAVAASKKKKAVGEDNLEEYETHTYTDSQGRKWRVDDEGNKDLIYDPNDRFGSKSRYSAPKKPEVYYFYAVPDGSAMKAFDLGLKRTKSGKWYASAPVDAATAEFGNPKKWMPKAEEAMMPASHFAGTPKHKLGPAAHLKGKMKRPARQGDLVGGSAEESYSKKKDIEEKLNPNDPVDVWVNDFLKANPERYHQFRQNNRPGTRKDDAYITRMAKAASYKAKTGIK